MEDTTEDLRQSKNTLILHHWDTDGICSAAMVKRYLQDLSAKTMVPRIGMYSLSEAEFRLIELGGFDAVTVVDLALPERDFDKLVELSPEVWVFDHHMKDRRNDLHQFNPVAHGSPSDNYPSTTWVLSELWDLPLDLLTVLGVVGDKAESIRVQKVFPRIEEYMESKGINFDELFRLTQLIDSNYGIGDASEVDKAVSLVLEHEEDLLALLANDVWIRNAERLKKIIAKEEESAGSPSNGILVHRFLSDLDIISAISRRLSKQDGVRTSVVIQSGFFEEFDRVYVRTSDCDIDLSLVLHLTQGEGHISGGKREVVGAIIPKEHTDALLAEVLKLLEAS